MRYTLCDNALFDLYLMELLSSVKTKFISSSGYELFAKLVSDQNKS